MTLFGQFVGDWEFSLVSIHPDGTRLEGSGEWHFGWALQGWAVQDVWIARDDISKGNSPISEWGTTLRFYDAKRDLWHVVWAGPMRGNLITFTGKRVGDEIIMEVDSVQELSRVNSSADAPVRRGQWIFDHITSNSFHWRAVTSSRKYFSVVVEMAISFRYPELLLEIAVHSKDPSDVGDIRGTRKNMFGDGPEAAN